MEMEKKFFPSVDQQEKEDKSLGSEPRETGKGLFPKGVLLNGNIYGFVNYRFLLAWL